jgi:hypothetical protein
MDELVSKLNAMLGELVEARDRALKHAEDEARRANALAEELARSRPSSINYAAGS